MSKFKIGDKVMVAYSIRVDKYENGKLDSGYFWYEEDLTLIESSQNA